MTIEEGKLNHLLLEITSDGEMAVYIKLVKKQEVAQGYQAAIPARLKILSA